MLHRLRIAALFSLTLSAACASSTGSQSNALDTGDTFESTDRCFRSFGDYAGDVTPPPVGIPVGDSEVSAQEAIELAQQTPSDPRAALLAEYATTILNADAGADLSEYEVDLLISADTLLQDSSAETELDLDRAEEMLELVSLLAELNTGLSLEVPCRHDQADTLDQTPLVPKRPDITGPRDRAAKGLFLGRASADAPQAPGRSAPRRPGAET